MTSDDTAGPGADQGRDHAGGARGPHGDADPVREFLLGVANQIDQLAALFADGGLRASTDGNVLGALLAEVPGEITTLLSEIGDLIARLIAALIAVLEAIAKALRSTPSAGAAGAPRYQPIAVRIDVTDPPPASGRHRGSES